MHVESCRLGSKATNNVIANDIRAIICCLPFLPYWCYVISKELSATGASQDSPDLKEIQRTSRFA